MTANKQGLHEAFLAYLVKGHGNVTIFLTNGVKLSGSISAVDHDCITLSRDGVTQLVMKHAIATIMPQDAFQVYDILGS